MQAAHTHGGLRTSGGAHGAREKLERTETELQAATERLEMRACENQSLSQEVKDANAQVERLNLMLKASQKTCTMTKEKLDILTEQQKVMEQIPETAASPAKPPINEYAIDREEYLDVLRSLEQATMKLKQNEVEHSEMEVASKRALRFLAKVAGSATVGKHELPCYNGATANRVGDAGGHVAKVRLHEGRLGMLQDKALLLSGKVVELEKSRMEWEEQNKLQYERHMESLRGSNLALLERIKLMEGETSEALAAAQKSQKSYSETLERMSKVSKQNAEYSMLVKSLEESVAEKPAVKKDLEQLQKRVAGLEGHLATEQSEHKVMVGMLQAELQAAQLIAHNSTGLEKEREALRKREEEVHKMKIQLEEEAQAVKSMQTLAKAGTIKFDLGSGVGAGRPGSAEGTEMVDRGQMNRLQRQLKEIQAKYNDAQKSVLGKQQAINALQHELNLVRHVQEKSEAMASEQEGLIKLLQTRLKHVEQQSSILLQEHEANKARPASAAPGMHLKGPTLAYNYGEPSPTSSRPPSIFRGDSHHSHENKNSGNRIMPTHVQRPTSAKATVLTLDGVSFVSKAN
ncbi:hypothetical protein CYMTET_23843 [Cymbomonas tetramitiformis]|uniref:Uncharacterized protein n=1 Tax=Cymbomonas tetramitiformis TaxID=36881 RepID=A0AAE0FX54_9CHLO|nr:hypothetical protein CYMTET_23843 [Cymbomonas tetramitiformis]